MAPIYLDEEAIATDLELPICRDTYSYVMRGSVGVMIDLHDRKVTRDNYKAMLTSAMQLYSGLNKANQLHSVRDAFVDGSMTLEKIETAIDGQERLCRTHLNAVKQTLELLMQCPDDPKEIN